MTEPVEHQRCRVRTWLEEVGLAVQGLPAPPRWVGSESHEYDPDPDDLTRNQLAETHPDAAVIAEVLDEWLLRCHGVTSGAHHAGAFLDFLAARGYEARQMPPVPSLDELLPPAED